MHKGLSGIKRFLPIILGGILMMVIGLLPIKVSADDAVNVPRNTPVLYIGGELVVCGDTIDTTTYKVSKVSDGEYRLDLASGQSLPGIEIASMALNIYIPEGATVNVGTVSNPKLQNVYYYEDANDPSTYGSVVSDTTTYPTTVANYSIYAIGGGGGFEYPSGDLGGSCTINCAGGLSGGNSYIVGENMTLNVGTADSPAAVGFENLYSNDPIDNTDWGIGRGIMGVEVSGTGRLNVYATNALNNVECLVARNGGIATINSTNAIGNTAFVVSFDGEIHVNSVGGMGSAKYYTRYLDPTLSTYTVTNDSTQVTNTKLLEVTSSNDHCTLETTGTGANLISTDGQVTTFSWDQDEIENGGGFEFVEVYGFMLDRGDSGEYTWYIEVNTPMQIKVLPKYGYKFNASSITRDNEGSDPTPVSLDAQTDAAVYKFTTPENCVHLAECYEEADNRFDGMDAGLEDGFFEVGEGEDMSSYNGTLAMTATSSDANADDFLNVIADSDSYEVATVIDLGINSEIQKGNSEEYWEGSEITEFSEDVQVFIPLSGDLEGITEDSTVQVVRDHNGVKTVVESQVMNVEGTLGIYFESNEFSTYAIAYTEAEMEDYSVNAEDGSLAEFKAPAGLNWLFVCLDLVNPTDEVLQALDATKEEYDAVAALIKSAVEGKDTNYLSVFVLEIMETNTGATRTEGPFKVKIKLSDDLKALISEKGYNTFVFYEVDTSTEVPTLGDSVTATLDGDYLVATFPHFSIWALSGKYVEPTSNTDNSGSNSNNSSNDSSNNSSSSNSNNSSSSNSNNSSSSNSSSSSSSSTTTTTTTTTASNLASITPKTSADSSMMIWLVLAIISLGTMTTLGVSMYKKAR